MKYKEIASYIREKVIEGDWFYGMRLPSHRDLANQFNVNRVTIIKSIELLESEGFIYTKRGSGTYVNDYLNESFVLNKWTEMMEWSSRTRSQYTVQLINKLEADKDYIHLSKGELGNDILPHGELKQAMNHVSEYIGDLAFGYNNGYGYIHLREHIASRLKAYNINVSSKNILITSGALHAIQLLSTGFLSQNTKVFYDPPAYIDSTNAFEFGNMHKISVPYNQSIEAKQILEKYASYLEKAFYVEPTFSNPSGKVLSDSARENILNYSRMHNTPVLEDDIYWDIWLENAPPPPIKSLDKGGNVIHIGSFSKTIAPAIRVGWIAASETIVEQLGDIRMQIDYGSSILSQMVVYEMLKSGDYDKHIKNVRKSLKGKRDFMLNVLNEEFFSVAEWNNPEGGFFIWLQLNEDIDIKKLFAELTDKERILINPGFIYGSKENTIRLSYAFENTANIEHALKILRKYIDRP